MTRWLLLRGLSREKRHREQFPQIREHTILAQTANNPDLDLDALARRWAQYLQSQRPSSAGVVRQIAAAVTFRMPRHIDTPLLILTALREQDREFVRITRHRHQVRRPHRRAPHRRPRYPPR